jgi:hypothetical protein
MDSSADQDGARRKRGRPKGQFAYNRDRLYEFLRYQPDPCTLTNVQLAEEMAPLVAGRGDRLSTKQVSRWLGDLTKRGLVKTVMVYVKNWYGWRNFRRIYRTKQEV